VSNALRSLLFVPGDNERKLAGAAARGADALILDLEDAVAPARKAAARIMVANYLDAGSRAVPLYVRINALQTGEAAADLAAVVAGQPVGIMLPKSEPGQVAALDRQLAVLESQHGLNAGGIAIIAIATETPAALFAIGDYPGVSARLRALTWGGEDLAADLGVVNRDTAGEYTPTFQLARTLCVLGAAAAGVAAIDAAFMNFSDDAALERECLAARRDGYVGKLAIHPKQVSTINRVFTPTAVEIDWAQRVVAAFRDQPALGVIAIDGKVVDRPHLRLAERLLRFKSV
jgi:citrate lyase subunit beta/citryl-CoA lyase